MKVLVKYRSVELIEKNDGRYQYYCKKMKFIKNSNRFVGERDAKQLITSWLERVIIKHLSSSFTHDTRNILTWEELNFFNHYNRKYSEIDGLFCTSDGTLYVEVKASLSKSSFSRGKSQINKNLNLISIPSKNSKAALVMADCRCFDPTFGFSKEYVETQKAKNGIYKYIEGLTFPNSFSSSLKWIWLLNQDDVQQLAEMYGSPYTEANSETLNLEGLQ
jgi:hypothetical protein